MKNYYAPDTDMHEIPIENFVADIYTGQEIISKTENLGKVKRRMFLGVARGVKDLDEGTESSWKTNRWDALFRATASISCLS